MEHKEAIEIVKKNYPHVGFSGSQFETALRVLVPELAESEDERIRKEIIEHLNWALERGSLPNDVIQSKRVGDWIFWLEKQKEQKPAEWSEEDSRILYNVIAYVGYAAGQRGVRDDEFKEANSWLKSLRPQLKREAWTEEDSLAIKEIQNALVIYMINHGISEKQRKKLARWLDIHCNAYPLPAKLYPHWKPSEEQMRCLLDCVSKAKEIHNASVGGYDAYRILVSLYDELHKLL